MQHDNVQWYEKYQLIIDGQTVPGSKVSYVNDPTCQGLIIGVKIVSSVMYVCVMWSGGKVPYDNIIQKTIEQISREIQEFEDRKIINILLSQR